MQCFVSEFRPKNARGERVHQDLRGKPPKAQVLPYPRGIIEKTAIAYDFIKRQRALYEDARNNLLAALHALTRSGVKNVAIFGRPPLAESAMLYLISEGVSVSALYVAEPIGMTACNRIPVLPLDEFRPDCETLVLIEPLPDGHEARIPVPKAICYPVA